jgi:hypothetical protein
MAISLGGRILQMASRIEASLITGNHERHPSKFAAGRRPTSQPGRSPAQKANPSASIETAAAWSRVAGKSYPQS